MKVIEVTRSAKDSMSFKKPDGGEIWIGGECILTATLSEEDEVVTRSDELSAMAAQSVHDQLAARYADLKDKIVGSHPQPRPVPTQAARPAPQAAAPQAAGSDLAMQGDIEAWLREMCDDNDAVMNATIKEATQTLKFDGWNSWKAAKSKTGRGLQATHQQVKKYYDGWKAQNGGGKPAQTDDRNYPPADETIPF